MKKEIILLSVVITLIVIGMLHSNGVFGMDAGGHVEPGKPQEIPISKCDKLPIYGKLDDCLKCHTLPDFKLKEADPYRHLNLPDKTELWKDDIGYFLIDDMSASTFKNAIRFLYDRDVKHVIVEVKSFGGSLFEAWDIQSTMAEYEKKGVVFETRCSAYAMSAGFVILVAGTKGHRMVSSKAELMFHELWTFEMFKISTPSSTEDQARILRHIQDTASGWLSSRCNLTKEEIDKKVYKREWWMNGKEAKEVGLVDGFLD
jgi:ATP-dependent protease ClpP protease subunit